MRKNKTRGYYENKTEWRVYVPFALLLLIFPNPHVEVKDKEKMFDLPQL